MKKMITRIIAAVMAAAMAIMLTGCAEDKTQYEHLKTDIIGIWIAEGGPEEFENGDTPYYRFYEFTSAGEIVYHALDVNGDFYEIGGNYEIKDNYFIVNGGRAMLNIEGDNMSMLNDDGEQKYVRLSMEEVTSYYVYYVDSGMSTKQLEYINKLKEDAKAADSESTTGAASEEITESVSESAADEAAETTTQAAA